MKRAVIIVAGGKGLRMGGDVPKQFMLIDGRPILMHTIEQFHRYDATLEIVVVLPADQAGYWEELCSQYCFDIAHAVAQGGPERFFSVRNGLEAVDSDAELIAIHDGVRPYVSREVIGRCYEEAMRSGAAIPVVEVYETMRQLTPEGSQTVPRSNYRLVQTPQTFRSEIIRQAYRQDFNPQFTDDASVVEELGYRIALVEGNRENIKITTPSDIQYAEFLCK